MSEKIEELAAWVKALSDYQRKQSERLERLEADHVFAARKTAIDALTKRIQERLDALEEDTHTHPVEPDRIQDCEPDKVHPSWYGKEQAEPDDITNDKYCAQYKQAKPPTTKAREWWVVHYHSIREGDLVRMFSDKATAQDYCRDHKISFLTKVREVLPDEEDQGEWETVWLKQWEQCEPGESITGAVKHKRRK